MSKRERTGGQPGKRNKKIMDPDVFDDCGEDLGELELLQEDKEELSWQETSGNQVNDYFLDESKCGISDCTHWLGAGITHPKAWHFSVFPACSEHLKTFNRKAQQGYGDYYVDIIEIMMNAGCLIECSLCNLLRKQYVLRNGDGKAFVNHPPVENDDTDLIHFCCH